MDDLVEVKLVKPENFLIIKESLERMGISSRKSNTLYQSCHILFKRGKYYIVHFKELFHIDGKTTDISEEDLERRNLIISLLQEWRLVDVVNPELIVNRLPINKLKIISHNDKSNWELKAKYLIGNN